MTHRRRFRILAATAALAGVAGLATAASALDRESATPLADPETAAALTELRDVQDRPVVDGTLVRVAPESPSRGGLGMWAYRSQEGRDEVMITRGGSATFLSGCAAPAGALQLCGLRMHGGEGVTLVGRSGPGVDAVVVASAIATRTATPSGGYWIVLLPESPGNPSAALPVSVRALSGGAQVGSADPALPR